VNIINNSPVMDADAINQSNNTSLLNTTENKVNQSVDIPYRASRPDLYESVISE
jgi:hypothetical protein